MGPEFQKPLRACGWWTINKRKVESSPADFWVFVLLGFEKRIPDFVVVPIEALRRRMRTHTQQIIQSYLWVTNDERCWEARGLPREKQLQIAAAKFAESRRDFTKWLNNWAPVSKLNEQGAKARH
jgi:hypothetical protein